MKKISMSLALGSILAISSASFAQSNAIEKTQSGIAAALEQFQADHAAHASHFTGVKGWPAGDSIKVKVYLTMNGKESAISYTCSEMNHGGEVMMMCN